MDSKIEFSEVQRKGTKEEQTAPLMDYIVTDIIPDSLKGHSVKNVE